MKSSGRVLYSTVIVSIIAFLQFPGAQGDCQGKTTELTAWSDTFTTPGFPDGYPTQSDCRWTIRLYQYSRIQLFFSDFDLDASNSDTTTVCPDFVQIIDGIGLFNYCQWNTSAPYITDDNVVQVNFKSDNSSGTGKGFHLQYRGLCNSAIDVSELTNNTLPVPPQYIDQCNFTVTTTGHTGRGLYIEPLTTPSCVWKIKTDPKQEYKCLGTEGHWSRNDVEIYYDGSVIHKADLKFQSIELSDPCFGVTCKNGGTCPSNKTQSQSDSTLTSPSSQANESYCTCSGDFIGPDCGTLNPCSSNPCRHGSCTPARDDPSRPNCTCDLGYFGDACDIHKPCDGKPCQNTTCHVDPDSDSCVCSLGFYGDDCLVHVCSSGPCRNGGACLQSHTGFKCRCSKGWQGDRCQIIDDSSHCRQETFSYMGVAITSNVTAIGQTDVQPCPTGIHGNVIRRCIAAPGVIPPVAEWGQPDLSGCVSQLFLAIDRQAKALSHSTFPRKLTFLNITSVITEATAMDPLSDVKLYPGDLAMATTTVQTLANLVERTDSSAKQDLTEIAQGYGEAVDNLIHPATASVWSYTNEGYVESKVTSLLKSVETLSSRIAEKTSRLLVRRRRTLGDAIDNGDVISVNLSNLQFEVSVISQTLSEANNGTLYAGPDDSGSIYIPPAVFQRAARTSEYAHIGLYTAKYTSISDLFLETNRLLTTNGNTSSFVNSDVISGRILNLPEASFQDLSESVRVVFSLKNKTLPESLESNCVFLNMSARTKADRWLSTGCRRSTTESNSSYVVCYCSHLTNFAILMDIYDVEPRIDEVNMEILTYISYAGGGLSVLCCVISIVVYEFFRLRSERIRVHEMLAVTIILVQLLFLVGIDRTENAVVCKVLAICLHYFLTAMFCWMLVEGVHLYLVLVKVFKSRSHLKKYLAIGWGVPLILVGISAGIFHEHYGENDICWLSHTVLLVTFVPTVGLVIVINTVVLLVVMRIMMKSLAKGSKVTTEERSAVRSGMKAAVVLLPLLGLTWMFGFLSITNKETLIFTYLFTFFNCLQGVFFFVFHCLLSVDVQNAYERRSRQQSQRRMTESSLVKSRDRKSSYIDSSPYSTYHSKGSAQTVMTDVSHSSFDRKRSTRHSTGGRPHSVSFDDDNVFLQNGYSPHPQPVLHRRNSYEDVLSHPGSRKDGHLGNNIIPQNDTLRNNDFHRRSAEANGYIFYNGRDTHNDRDSFTSELITDNDDYVSVQK